MSTDADGPIETARENESALETIAGRDDRLGALARVALAGARGEAADSDDLDVLGVAGKGGRR